MMLLWKQKKKMTLWNVWSPTVVQELIEVIKVFKYYIVSKPQDNARENILLVSHSIKHNLNMQDV